MHRGCRCGNGVRVPFLRCSARAIQSKWNHVGFASQIGPSDSQGLRIVLSELSRSFSECATVDGTISARIRLRGTILSMKKFNNQPSLLMLVDRRHSRREGIIRFVNYCDSKNKYAILDITCHRDAHVFDGPTCHQDRKGERANPLPCGRVLRAL